MKKKIIFNTEASWLATGYSRLSRELLKRFHESGKYELAEIAAYGSPNDPRINEIPWKVYPVLPPQGDERGWAEYNSNPLNQFGKAKFEHAVLDFRPDHVCIPPGEQVLTKRGYIPIEKVKIGDLVLTHKSNWKKVTQVFKRQYEGSVYEIKNHGNRMLMKTTPEHPMLIFKQKKRSSYVKNIRTNETMYKDETPVFEQAKKIKPGDVLCYPLIPLETSQQEIDIGEYLDNFYEKDGVFLKHKTFGIKPIPRMVKFDFNFGVICGLLVGDGSMFDTGVSLFLGVHEKEIIKECCHIFKEKFGITPKIRKDTLPDGSRGNMFTIYFHSSILGEFFTKYIGRAKDKHVPIDILFGNEEIKKGFIRGITRSDGCYKKNTVSIETSRKNLANEIRALIGSIGIPTNLQKKTFIPKFPTKTAKKKSTTYSIEGYGSSATELELIVQKYDKTKYNIGTTVKKHRCTWVNQNFIVSKVKSVRIRYYQGQVYNLEVEDDNSYVVNQCCVHNCAARDVWYDNYINLSPFRRFFKFLWEPAVDAMYQQDSWIADYDMADCVLGYTNWATDLLKYQGLKNVKGAATLAVDFNTFYPIHNKKQLKASLGINPESIIVGKVARNQKRKKFPDLFHSFSRYLKINKSVQDKVFLLIHSTGPDIGVEWNTLIKESGLANKCYFTYICRNPQCNSVFVSFFQDYRTVCRKCNQFTASMPRSDAGVNDNDLNIVYNLMDVYVQLASAAGFELPVLEAASCGVPTLVMDYAGLSDFPKTIGSIPIEIESYDKEVETGRYLAKPNCNDLIEKLSHMVSLPDNVRRNIGFQCMERARAYYSWDKTSQVWMDYFDSVEFPQQNQWFSPSHIHQPNLNIPDNLDNENFVRAAFHQVLGRPDLINSYFYLKTVKNLTNGFTSNLGERATNYSRQDLINELVNMVNFNNLWETRRWEKFKNS